MNSRSRSREDTQQPFRPRALSRPRRFRLGLVRAFETGSDFGLRRLPFGEPGTNHHRLDDTHDLVAVGVMRAKLRALVRVEPALKQSAQDRWIDLRPVERRHPERCLDLGLRQRQGSIVIEQPAVKP